MANTDSPVDNDAKISMTMRFSPAMHDLLKRSAKSFRRTLTAEVMYRLEMSLAGQSTPKVYLDPILEKLAEVTELVKLLEPTCGIDA